MSFPLNGLTLSQFKALGKLDGPWQSREGLHVHGSTLAALAKLGFAESRTVDRRGQSPSYEHQWRATSAGVDAWVGAQYLLDPGWRRAPGDNLVTGGCDECGAVKPEAAP